VSRPAPVWRRHFWSTLLAVAYKEALVVRHDRAFMGVVLIQPIVMLILFGVALSNKPANVPWGVMDRSQTAASRRLVAEVQATGYFLPPRAVASYGEARALLRRQALLAVLIVAGDFGRDVVRGTPQVQLLLDGSDPLTAARLGGYVGQVGAAFEAGSVGGQRLPRPPAPTGTPGAIDVRQRFWFNPTLLDRLFFLSALPGMLLTNLCLSVTALGLVGERESGTFEQMLALPTTSTEIVLGKLVPYVAVCYAVLLFETVIAGVVFGIWPQGSWLALLGVTFPFVLASLAIGVFVSALARTSAQAVFITTFFILPSFVLSGVMFPYQLMPNGVRQLGGLFPLRWYQIALRRIIERGGGMLDVIVPTLALVALFGVLLGGIRMRMRSRLG
jgi:ABC-2 type transport system permease protein